MKKLILTLMVVLILSGCSFNNKEIKMADLSKMSLHEVEKYAKDNNLKLDIKKEYDEDIAKDKVISQSIEKGSVVKQNTSLTVTISLGSIPNSVYEENKVNELGNVPIMMYHKIEISKDKDSPYPGGNVDKDGYARTKDAFIADLEMYYKKGYRMVRLIDYMNGNINVPLGKSPIILTFDDGNKNNFNVTGVDEEGNLEIDSNCAVGILESFKKKYKDFNVTATFFLNKGLFNQSKYNNQILEWLVSHGYDIGNHTKSHPYINKISATETEQEIAYMYKLFDEIIPNKYVHIVALPYGSPYKKDHTNFPYVLNGNDGDYKYTTEGTLRVGWDANYSPFSVKFDKTYMMRVRAWDDNGEDFDIQRVFNNLESAKYVSDGNNKTIVIKNDTNLNLNIKDKKIIKY